MNNTKLCYIYIQFIIYLQIDVKKMKIKNYICCENK